MDTEPLAQLRRLNLMHALLSRVNRAIVRVDSPDALYQEVCRIAVESGLFDVARIGLIDPDSGRMRTMARWGSDENNVDRISAGLYDVVAPEAAGGVLSFICNDLEASLSASPAIKGLAAMGRFALFEAGRLVGALELYSAHAGFFDAEVVSLAEEVAGDISFALEHLQQEQKRLAAESRAHYLTYYDSQTGLPGRALLEERLQQLTAAGEAATPLALLDIRLQRLEPIARVLGHIAMDEMLRTLAQRLEDCGSLAGLVAQLSQTEFVMVLPGLTDHDVIGTFARQVQRRLCEALTAGGHEVFLSAGIGVARYPQDEHQLLSLLQRARVAAEQAVREGEVCFYRPELDYGAESRLTMEGELHRALEHGEFELHYQPQMNLKTGAMVGVEALLRWRHSVKGLLEPALFVPLLEDSGLMVAVGEWVLRTACAQSRAWQDAGLPPLRMAINLSAQQFWAGDLVEKVKSALDDSGLAAEWLELELTESLILEDAERIIATMHKLKALGISLSLDDFGTGFSSLSYLRRFPIDRIKIDQSFVRDITTHTDAAALARTILSMAQNLGMATIAEGVELAGQMDYLRQYACDEMQGFLFSRALPTEELAQCLREERKLAR